MVLLKIFDWSLVANSTLYSMLGIIILIIAFVAIEKLTPNHILWKEVVEKKNMALAIIAASFIIAIAIIIASAIH